MAFLLLLAFLATDAFFDNVSNVLVRKYIVIADFMCFGKSLVLVFTEQFTFLLW